MELSLVCSGNEPIKEKEVLFLHRLKNSVCAETRFLKTVSKQPKFLSYIDMRNDCAFICLRARFRLVEVEPISDEFYFNERLPQSEGFQSLLGCV